MLTVTEENADGNKRISKPAEAARSRAGIALPAEADGS